MKLSNSRFTFGILLLMLMLHISSFSQSKKQQELEERRRELQREIKQIGSLLFEGKKEQKSVISVVEDLNFKIQVRKNLFMVMTQRYGFKLDHLKFLGVKTSFECAHF